VTLVQVEFSELELVEADNLDIDYRNWKNGEVAKGEDI
jgi:hypothetical protein